MIMNNEMPDRWYSTKEICAYLGISRDTMLVWIATKNMPAHMETRGKSTKQCSIILEHCLIQRCLQILTVKAK